MTRRADIFRGTMLDVFIRNADIAGAAIGIDTSGTGQ
jgi:hypothetical protein